VYLYGNGMLLDGMTYQLDPSLKEPVQQPGGRGNCNDKAKDLLKYLTLGREGEECLPDKDLSRHRSRSQVRMRLGL
jgi:hypothetical protein